MADNLQVQRATSDEGEMFDATGREHSEKLQQLARTVVSSLYMLVRSVKMYDPDNSVFDKPLIQLQDAMNFIIRREGKLELMGVKQSFYINGMLVKVDMARARQREVLARGDARQRRRRPDDVAVGQH